MDATQKRRDFPVERRLRQYLVGAQYGHVDPVRSRIMAAIGGKNTKPELIVRRLAHAMGFRYRLHVRTLPGTPDLVFTSRRRVIDVRGCFWHVHGCSHSRIPSVRTSFWRAKLHRNRQRDQAAVRRLRRMGWRVLVIWECQLKNRERVARRIKYFLTEGASAGSCPNSTRTNRAR